MGAKSDFEILKGLNALHWVAAIPNQVLLMALTSIHLVLG